MVYINTIKIFGFLKIYPNIICYQRNLLMPYCSQVLYASNLALRQPILQKFQKIQNRQSTETGLRTCHIPILILDFS